MPCRSMICPGPSLEGAIRSMTWQVSWLLARRHAWPSRPPSSEQWHVHRFASYSCGAASELHGIPFSARCETGSPASFVEMSSDYFIQYTREGQKCQGVRRSPSLNCRTHWMTSARLGPPATNRMRALPTMTPSEWTLDARASSGVAIPNPTSSGFFFA
jgi:hypothetical protein